MVFYYYAHLFYDYVCFTFVPSVRFIFCLTHGRTLHTVLTVKQYYYVIDNYRYEVIDSYLTVFGFVVHLVKDVYFFLYVYKTSTCVVCFSFIFIKNLYLESFKIYGYVKLSL